MPTQLFRDYLARVGDPPAGHMVGLLTVSRDSEVLLRLASEREHSVLSRGETFHASGFDFRIPDRTSEGEQRTAFVLPVADRVILEALRGEPLTLSLVFEIAFSPTPDEVEIGPLRMVDRQRVFETETQTLALECSFRDALRNPRPGRKYSPSAFPGLFAAPNLQGVL